MSTDSRSGISDKDLTNFFATKIDGKDAATFARTFTEDGKFRFGNPPAAVGRAQIESAVGGFFGMLAAVKHELKGIQSGTWEHGEIKSVEADVTYTRKDGTKTDPLPVVLVLRYKERLIADLRVYMDVSPLFAPNDASK